MLFFSFVSYNFIPYIVFLFLIIIYNIISLLFKHFSFTNILLFIIILFFFLVFSHSDFFLLVFFQVFTIIHLCSHGCFFCVCSPLFFLCFSVCVFLFSSCRLVFISFIPPFYVFVCFVSFFLVLSVSVSVWFLSAFFNYIIQKNNNLLFTCLLACVCVCVCVFAAFIPFFSHHFLPQTFFFSYLPRKRTPSLFSLLLALFQ